MIRLAVAADLPTLERIAHEAYALYLPRMDRPPAPMLADYTASVAAGEVWVDEEAGELKGLIVLQGCGDHVLIENVAVAPTAQGGGVGRKLVAFAELEARRLGSSELRLYTNEAMTENLTFYPRLGFIETHRAVEGGYRRVFFRKPV